MKALKIFCIIGAIITIVMGTISHFVYDWSGGNFFVGLFFSVNESTWEHLKLLFFPMLAYALFAGKKIEESYPCIYNAMFTGILTGLGMIPVLFYTYTGILGYNVDWLNIATYIASVIVAYCVVYRTAKKGSGKKTRVLTYLMYALILVFMVFTVYPPNLGLFVSP